MRRGGYKSEAGGYRAPFSNPFIEPKAGDEWLPDRLTNDAMDFMSNHKNAPFFINLHYYTVHRPIKSRSDELYKKYEEKAKTHFNKKMKPKKKDLLIGYATMVENMDENIGRLMAYLDKNNLRENTIIVFSSDNGVHSMVSHDYPLRGAKGQIYEGGVRVPTLMNWKGKINARRSEAPISSVDYFPTFMDLANINYSGQLDGNSVVPLFSKEERSLEERTVFWHLASRFKHGTCTAMRKGDYKLIQFLKDGKLELYNLKNDPKESENLAEIKADLATELLKEMVNWRKNNNVPLPPNSTLEY